MSSAGLSATGLVSGIDTASIVSDLMRVERIPVDSMERRKNEAQTKIDAFSRVTTKVSGVREALDGLGSLNDFAALSSVESTDDDSVSAKTSGATSNGSVTFSVSQLARQHQVASATGLASADASVGAGTFTLTIGGTDHDVVTGAGTSLSDLADSINSLGAGVSASVLQVGAGDFRLVTTADETGEDAAFSVSSTSANQTAFNVLQQAQNAELTLGEGAGALTLSRSSNTVSDLIGGVDITLKAISANPLTVTTSRDNEAAKEKITTLVNAVNAAITTAKNESKYSEEADERGALNGQNAIRDLVGNLQSVFSSPVPGMSGATSFASAVGIEINREGTFDIDEEKLTAALEDNFDGVASLFASQGTPTDARVGFSDSSEDTETGDYAVRVSQAARIAAITGASFASPPGDPEIFTIAAGGENIQVTIPAGATAAQAVDTINNAVTAAGLSTLIASMDDPDDPTSALTLADTRYGSNSFTVTSDSGTQNAFGLAGTHSGADVVGTINGEAAFGSGRTLTSSEGDAKGLSLTISASDGDVTAAGGDLDLGEVGYTRGLSGALSDLLDDVEGTDGSISRATGLLEGRIDDLDGRIEAFERRLELRETFLRRQFTAMEVAIAGLQSQSSFFFSQIGG